MNLSLCSGSLHAGDPNWDTLDADTNCEPDYIASIPPLPAVVWSQAPYDTIELIHGIEHFFPWEAAQLLKDCHDVLKTDGILILEQPNLLYCCRVLLGLEPCPEQQFPGQFDMAGIYGDQSHQNAGMMHKWGWEPITLGRTLMEVGFSRIVVGTPQYHSFIRDFRLEAYK